MRTLISRAGLAAAFEAAAGERARAWLADALAQVAEQPERIGELFPGAGRGCGREPLTGIWTADLAARVLLVTGRPWRGPEPAQTLYREGTAAERRAVLLALDVAGDADDSLLALTVDAIRSNDTRLIAAALGPFAARRLGAAEFRQAVLKCVFCGVPFSEIAGVPAADAADGAGRDAEPGGAVPDRTDPELARMLADFARERVAAGRAVPGDVWLVLRRFPAAVADSGLLAEPCAPDPVRAAAARQALAAWSGASPRESAPV